MLLNAHCWCSTVGLHAWILAFLAPSSCRSVTIWTGRVTMSWAWPGWRRMSWLRSLTSSSPTWSHGASNPIHRHPRIRRQDFLSTHRSELTCQNQRRRNPTELWDVCGLQPDFLMEHRLRKGERFLLFQFIFLGGMGQVGLGKVIFRKCRPEWRCFWMSGTSNRVERSRRRIGLC